jgi:uncharacterized membrane protein YphA (DoxX/SURF4 family)
MDFINRVRQYQTELWPLALARMAMGVLWLFSLRWKLPPEFVPESGRGLMDWLNLEVEHAAFGFYGDFVEAVVLPNFTVFAWLVFLSELTVGLLLLTGTLSRAAGLLGLLMSINLGIGLLEVPGEWPWAYAMMVMWHGYIIIGGAGRLWGVDSLLKDRITADSRLQWLI